MAVFNAGRVVALHPATAELRVVSDPPAEVLKGSASLARGAGPGFDAGCLYLTNLLKGGVSTICP